MIEKKVGGHITLSPDSITYHQFSRNDTAFNLFTCILFPIFYGNYFHHITESGSKFALIFIADCISYLCYGTTTTFGESFSLVMKGDGSPIKVNYRNSTKIRTLSIDLDFMLAYMSQEAFQYNGVNFPFDKAGTDLSKFSIENETRRLEYIKKIVQMLDTLGCEKDIDIKTLTTQDRRNIDYLVTAFVDKKEVTGLKDDLPGILSITVANLKFLLFLQKVEGKKGTYQIFDFFKTNFVLVYENLSGEKRAISQYAILHAEDFIQLDNIRFDVLLPSFQNIERHSETIIRANYFLLELLEAYDKSSGKIEILNTAKAFSDWIMAATEEELPYDIRLINQLQTVKRLRPLNIDEIKELFSVIECPNTSEDILVGAYLLLDQKPIAELHFNNLDKERQEEFRQFPIYHFWENNK